MAPTGLSFGPRPHRALSSVSGSRGSCPKELQVTRAVVKRSRSLGWKRNEAVSALTVPTASLTPVTRPTTAATDAECPGRTCG